MASFALRFVTMAVLVFPFAYFVNGYYGLGAAIIGFVFCAMTLARQLREIQLTPFRRRLLNAVADTVYGVSYSKFLPEYWHPQVVSYASIVQFLSAILCVGIMGGWVTGIVDASLISEFSKTERNKLSWTKKNKIMLGSFSWGPMLPLIFLPFFELEQQYSLYFDTVLKSNIILPLILTAMLGIMVTLQLFGVVVGSLLWKATQNLSDSGTIVVSELSTLGWAGAFFLASYTLICLFYSTIFAAVWRFDNSAFSGSGMPVSPTWFDFAYFSAITIATLGYGDIVPKSVLARVFVMSEVLVGVVWVTLVLAATVARLSKLPSAK